MTKRYTAADFANAKFAEHEDGRLAVRSDPSDHGAQWVDGECDWHSDEVMADDGWVPVPTKPTITESRLWELTEIDRTRGLSVRGVLQAYGVEVIPDPEPTNTERLETLLLSINAAHEGEELEGRAAIKAWAEALNEAGITAPNAKDN